MIDKLKDYGSLVIVIAVAVLACALFLRSALWASENLIDTLVGISLVLLCVDIFVLLPLSAVRRLRPYTGNLIYLSSYLFGFVTWLYGFMVTYSLWGAGAVVVGLLFFGVGVVFMAAIASLLKAMWMVLVTVIAFALVTYGSRILGDRLRMAHPAEGAIKLAVQ